MTSRLPLLAVALGPALVPFTAAAAPAATESASSRNWSGYAVTRSGTRFARVAGSWVQPRVRCTARRRASSVSWVGLGGYHAGSRALAQIGTVADCRAGRARYGAWYELVPAAWVDLDLRVRPGDRIAASVAVTGRRVLLRLANRTTGATANRRLRAAVVDTRSAEWILEAPTLCRAGATCRNEPLADFGIARFSAATARTAGGHAGPISDPAWTATAISLIEGIGAASPFGAGAASASATPTALSITGDAFSVGFRPAAA